MTAEEARDRFLFEFQKLCPRGYLVISKQRELEGILGSKRHLLMTKKEIEEADFDAYSKRLQKFVG